MSTKTKALRKVVEIKKNPTLMVATISITAGLAIIGGIKLVRYIKSKSAQRDAKKNNDKIQEEAKKKVLERKISDTDAKTYAKDLMDAFDGFGTDEDVIKEILLDKNLSATDVQAIFNAFGTPEYGTFGKPMWGTGTPMNLIEWIKKEMDNSTKLYAQLKTKFETSGYTF